MDFKTFKSKVMARINFVPADIKNFFSWLFLFIEALLYVITCANCLNWGVERKEWLVVIAGAVTLGLGAWRGYKRGRALWDGR